MSLQFENKNLNKKFKKFETKLDVIKESSDGIPAKRPKRGRPSGTKNLNPKNAREKNTEVIFCLASDIIN